MANTTKEMTVFRIPLADGTKQEYEIVDASARASLQNKQNTLTFDSTPTANSTNPITSGGVYTAISNIPNIWKNKKVCVFGDSIGVGYNNNNYSFVDILSESGIFASVHKNCLSGSTTATLNARLQESSTEVANADIIFCEYQGNDVSGIISGELTTSQLVTAVRTCNTYIRNLNTTCLIVWLPLTVLHFDKVGGTNASYYKAWASALYPVFAELGISILPIYDTLVAGHALSDGRHPNNVGHQVIANLIMQTPLGYTNYPTELLTEWTGGNY